MTEAPSKVRYAVMTPTPFGMHTDATFDTSAEAWAYHAEHAPYTKLRMIVREVPA